MKKDENNANGTNGIDDDKGFKWVPQIKSRPRQFVENNFCILIVVALPVLANHRRLKNIWQEIPLVSSRASMLVAFSQWCNTCWTITSNNKWAPHRFTINIHWDIMCSMAECPFRYVAYRLFTRSFAPTHSHISNDNLSSILPQKCRCRCVRRIIYTKYVFYEIANNLWIISFSMAQFRIRW